MIHHVADDLAVVIYNEQHRYAIGESEDRGHEATYLWCVCQIVESAAREETLGYKATPNMHQRHQRPGNRVCPDQHDEENHLTTR